MLVVLIKIQTAVVPMVQYPQQPIKQPHYLQYTMVTRAVEDYLKAIYKLQRDGSPATTNAIAEIFGVRAASVTAMVQQLSDHGMADYVPYRGATLTETDRLSSCYYAVD